MGPHIKLIVSISIIRHVSYAIYYMACNDITPFKYNPTKRLFHSRFIPLHIAPLNKKTHKQADNSAAYAFKGMFFVHPLQNRRVR